MWSKILLQIQSNPHSNWIWNKAKEDDQQCTFLILRLGFCNNNNIFRNSFIKESLLRHTVFAALLENMCVIRIIAQTIMHGLVYDNVLIVYMIMY